jgi:predicted ATPase
MSTTVINETTNYRLLDTTRAYAAAKLAWRNGSDRPTQTDLLFRVSRTR